MSDEAAPPSKSTSAKRDPYARLRLATTARIGLGQTGDSLPLKSVLDFQLDHARARDAVHATVDFAALKTALQPVDTIEVTSQASDRVTYLRRPDLGRRLDATSQALLPEGPVDIVLVVADGLSARAVDTQAAAVTKAILAQLPPELVIAPLILARQARVAIGDDIAEVLNARLVVVLIGERPGLSVADSLGIYLTFDPKRGRRDSERNCISNVHGAGGLSAEAAARKLVWLVREAFRLQLSGVGLKDDQDDTPLLGAKSD